MPKELIFVPTYNEQENVEPMCEQLLALPLTADILFVDDNSPDGTGRILDRLGRDYPRVSVKHRPGKLGIGSAHLFGIKYAYDHGYAVLITLDCDFTHEPADILKLLAVAGTADIAIGSRFREKDSLPNWNLMRRFLTHFGHFLTQVLLRMPYDATGGLRVYNLRTIPRDIFDKIQSRGYSFFFECLYLLVVNGFKVAEIPIVLPSRMYGHSKMTVTETLRSTRFLMELFWRSVINPRSLKLIGSRTGEREPIPEPTIPLNPVD